MDQAEVFTIILRRNALRRDARLPPLDVRAEYRRAVEHAYWREVHAQHYEAVREEVVQRLRQERDPDWGHSAGGRWFIEAKTVRELAERFRAENVQPAAALGYAVLDCLGDLHQNRRRK